MVHFVDTDIQVRETHCRAAVITRIWEEGNFLPDEEIIPSVEGSEWVALHVMLPTKCVSLRAVCHDEVTKQSRTWHWPERTG
jgi:hypothetical protein